MGKEYRPGLKSELMSEDLELHGAVWKGRDWDVPGRSFWLPVCWESLTW